MGSDRRAFLRNAGLGGGVLALGPLAASLAASGSASAAPANGKYDFDTPYNRIGTDCVKWDGAIRDEHMPPGKIVAGMGIADMDFECAPMVTAALQNRINHHNWGYELLDIVVTSLEGKSTHLQLHVVPVDVDHFRWELYSDAKGTGMAKLFEVSYRWIK